MNDWMPNVQVDESGLWVQYEAGHTTNFVLGDASMKSLQNDAVLLGFVFLGDS